MNDEAIPEDVREAADTAWLELASLDRPGRAEEVPIIARAILAERERCAKIAENHPGQIIVMWDRPGGPPGNGTRAPTMADIASSIRSSSHE